MPLLDTERNIVTPVAGTTRDSILSRYNKFGMDFYLIDTAGLRKKAKVTEDLEFYSVLRSIRSIESSDVCILMLDATAGIEAQDLNIFNLVVRNKKGCVIVVNKWDLIEKESNTMKEFAEAIRRRIAPFSDVPIVFTSVPNKQRILDVLQTAMRVYYSRIRKIPTSALNEYLLPIIEETPPPSTKGKYIRIKYVTQLASPTPSFAFFVNLPQYIKEGTAVFWRIRSANDGTSRECRSRSFSARNKAGIFTNDTVRIHEKNQFAYWQFAARPVRWPPRCLYGTIRRSAAKAKADSRPEFISYPTREAGETGDPANAPHYVSLAGKWRAIVSTTRQGGEPGFYKPAFTSTAWQEVDVPNTSVVQGLSPLEALTPPQLPAEIPLVQYRAVIDVPYLWLDRDMFIHVEGVGGAYTVYVNDRRIGYSDDSRTPTEFPISEAVTDGVNTIGIEVYGYSTGNWMETLLPQLQPGSLGGVYVYSQPKLRIEDFVIRTQSDTTKVHGWVDFAVVMSNSYRSAEKITFGYDIYSPTGKSAYLQPDRYGDSRQQHRYAGLPRSARKYLEKHGLVARPAEPVQTDALHPAGRPDHRIHSVEIRVQSRGTARRRTVDQR